MSKPIIGAQMLEHLAANKKAYLLGLAGAVAWQVVFGSPIYVIASAIKDTNRSN